MNKDNLSDSQIALLNSTFRKDNKDIAKIVIEKGNDDFIPISGGNTIPVEMYKKFISEFTDTDIFIWFLIYQRYFTNLYYLENATPQENSAFKNYLAGLFWFGTGAFTWDNNKLYSWGLTTTKSDINGDIIDGTIWTIGLAISNPQSKIIAREYPNSNIVYGKNNYNALPTILSIVKMIKTLNGMLDAFDTNMSFAAKKMRYKIRNNDSAIIRQEMKIFNDKKTAIIGEITPVDEKEISNIMEELKFSSDTNLLEQIKSYIGLMQTYNGIYSNTNFKKERNISNEFKGDELMTEIQLMETRLELEKVIADLNEKKGSKYILKYRVEDYEQEESEQDYYEDDSEKPMKEDE